MYANQNKAFPQMFLLALAPPQKSTVLTKVRPRAVRKGSLINKLGKVSKLQGQKYTIKAADGLWLLTALKIKNLLSPALLTAGKACKKFEKSHVHLDPPVCCGLPLILNKQVTRHLGKCEKHGARVWNWPTLCMSSLGVCTKGPYLEVCSAVSLSPSRGIIEVVHFSGLGMCASQGQHWSCGVSCVAPLSC
eukprot:1158773-Pelagomonas_calceolata.AAC.3